MDNRKKWLKFLPYNTFFLNIMFKKHIKNRSFRCTFSLSSQERKRLAINDFMCFLETKYIYCQLKVGHYLSPGYIQGYRLKNQFSNECVSFTLYSYQIWMLFPSQNGRLGPQGHVQGHDKKKCPLKYHTFAT